MVTRSSVLSRFGHLPTLLAANVGLATGLFVHAFLYNFYLESLGYTALHFGRAQAALTAGGLVALLPAGRLVDRLGARSLTLLATLLAALGLAASALAQREAAIYGASFLAGAGAASWRVGSGPLLLAVAPAPERSRSFSWNVALLVAAGGVAFAGAGVLADWLREHRLAADAQGAHRIVLLLGALVTAASATILRRLPDARPSAAPPTAATAGASPTRAPAEPRLLALAGAVAVWMLAAALVMPFFNVYFARVHGLPVRTVGLVFGFAHVVTAGGLLASAEIAARRSPERALRLWLVVPAIALVALALAPGVGVAVALYLVQGLVGPATNPLIDQLMLERARPDRRGALSSWRNTATELSGVTGATIGGAVLASASFATLFGLAAGVAVLGACALIVALRVVRITEAAPAADGSHVATTS